MCQVQYCVTQQHQQLLVLAPEQTSQRLLPCFVHDAVSHPLPKLGLCRPKLFAVAADHQRSFLFPFLLLVATCRCISAHMNTLHPLRGHAHTETPWGSLSCEAAFNCQQLADRNPRPRLRPRYVNRRVCNSATNGSEWAELGSVVTLGNSLTSINVSMNHSRRHVSGKFRAIQRTLLKCIERLNRSIASVKFINLY